MKTDSHRDLLVLNEIKTPLGEMIAVFYKNQLSLFNFKESPKLKNQMQALKQKLNACFFFERTPLFTSLTKELTLYFEKKGNSFETAIDPLGTSFQKKVWDELKKIPYGTTVSYTEIAKKVQNPLGCRAVAQAISTNPLVILVPCHRVIQLSGQLGGYLGGYHRKKWLLQHEGGLS